MTDMQGDAPTPQEKTRRRRASTAGWLFIVLVVTLGLTGTSPWWGPPVASILPWSPREEEDRLGAELAHLEGQVKAIQQRATQDQAAQQQQAKALADITARVTALEQRPNTASGIDPAELQALQEKLRAVAETQSQASEHLAALDAQGNAAGATRNDQALLVALGQVRAQFQAGHPFAAELRALQALSPNSTTLHTLDAPAAKGIPTVTELTHRFTQDVAPAILRADATPESGDWSTHILARLRSLVVIRRIDNDGNSDDPVETAVNRAELALKRDNLADAVTAVQSLPPAAATAAKSWLADAEAHLAADRALTAISQDVAARLAGAPAAKEPGAKESDTNGAPEDGATER